MNTTTHIETKLNHPKQNFLPTLNDLTLYTQNYSPFCRKVYVTAKELNVLAQTQIHDVNTSPIINNPIVNQYNPLGKVPILTHGERVILDSVRICAYLNSLVQERNLYGETIEATHQINLIETIADGICDAAILVKHERERRLSRSSTEAFEQGQLIKIIRSLAALDQHETFFTDSFHLGHIAAAVAIDWLEFLDIEIEMKNYPKLKAWMSKIKKRHSLRDSSYKGGVDYGFLVKGYMTQALQYSF